MLGAKPKAAPAPGHQPRVKAAPKPAKNTPAPKNTPKPKDDPQKGDKRANVSEGASAPKKKVAKAK